jgi:two-component system cell cycle response regulator DivK
MLLRDDQKAQRGGKVLGIEDDALNLRLVRDLLEMEGFEVCEAQNARERMAMAGIHRPHLILMDIQLPDMDGREATRLLKGDPRLGGIPVVALTS